LEQQQTGLRQTRQTTAVQVKQFPAGGLPASRLATPVGFNTARQEMVVL
jgi:hypothetical protein